MRNLSRLALLLRSLVLVLCVRAVAEEEPAARKQVSAEHALAFLRTFVRQRRAGRAGQAWKSYDGAAFARRAFGRELHELDSPTSALVLDLVHRGVPAMDARSPFPWTQPGATIRGRYAGRGTDPIADALLVGVACELDAHTIFVKFVGPRGEVEPGLERFKVLCATIRVR